MRRTMSWAKFFGVPPGLVRNCGREKQVARLSAFGITDFLGGGRKGGHSMLCQYKEERVRVMLALGCGRHTG
jgi:hypothetical protein